MGSVSLGLGVAHVRFGETTIVWPHERRAIPARDQVRLRLPLRLFGEGFGFDFEPMLAVGDLTSVGAYVGPSYWFRADRLHFRLGAGLDAGYLPAGPGFDRGLDLFGRIPVGATYWVSTGLGLFGELGIGFGATGLVPARTGSGARSRPLEFGTRIAADLGIGVRFP